MSLFSHSEYTLIDSLEPWWYKRLNGVLVLLIFCKVICLREKKGSEFEILDLLFVIICVRLVEQFLSENPRTVTGYTRAFVTINK